MWRAAVSRPAIRLAAFYAAIFLVTGVQLLFWPIWLASRGLSPEEIGYLLAAAIWVKVVTTPAIGAVADRATGHRTVMAVLAATALAAYMALIWSSSLWLLIPLNLGAFAAQSALMPLGDSITLAAARSEALDYGRVRVWGSASFVLASVASGAALTAGSGERVIMLVAGTSAVLLISCLCVPGVRTGIGAKRRIGLGAVARDARFWLLIGTASALQSSHQVYYGFGTLHWRSLGFSDTAIGWLWAEGVLAEIVLFWFGRPLVARIGPVGMMALGGGAGILRWSLTGALTWLPSVVGLQLLHALTFGASQLGAMHFLSRAPTPYGAASVQSLYTALSSAIGSGVVMTLAGTLYSSYGGAAYYFMAVLSAAGLVGAVGLRAVTAENRNQ